MTRIEEFGREQMRRDLIPSLLNDLEKVAAEGSDLAYLLSCIDEERNGSMLISSLESFSGVLVDYFNSVLNFVASMRNLAED